MDFKEFVETHTIGEIKKAYPQIKDYLDNTGLWNLPDNLTFAKAFEDIDEEDLWQVGIRDGNIADELKKYLSAMQNLENKDEVKVHKLTINGGKTKLGEAENIQVEIFAGQVISIVGPTGSGKSRLLADIECLAQEDTPTKRQILIDDEILDDEARFNLEGKLVAQLSQNMNFIMDITVEDFLTMHAKVRLGKEIEILDDEARFNLEGKLVAQLSQNMNFIMDITVEDFLTMHAKVRLGKEIENEKAIIAKCFSMANELAGEKFTLDTKVTQLSGGQSRALMIADVACISSSPFVLIDEIENAGIDRQKAIKCLAKSEKIVIMSTHDPLLALNADKRIVIKNGGISKIIETTAKEKACIEKIRQLDETLLNIRSRLRLGDLIENIN